MYEYVAKLFANIHYKKVSQKNNMFPTQVNQHNEIREK